MSTARCRSCVGGRAHQRAKTHIGVSRCPGEPPRHQHACKRRARQEKTLLALRSRVGLPCWPQEVPKKCWNGQQGNAADFASGMARQVGNDLSDVGKVLNPLMALAHAILYGDD